MKLQDLYEKRIDAKKSQQIEKNTKLAKSIYENPAFEYNNSYELLKASFMKNRHAYNSYEFVR